MVIFFNYFRAIFFIIALAFLSISTLFNSTQDLILIEWTLEINSAIRINFPVIIDKPSLITASTVLFISANVLLFSNTYIVEEKEKNRFLLIILLFIASIMLLVFIPHIVFLLIGWDGLGLVRFLLVIHYPTPQALRSGYITVMTNRIGDALIILRIPLLFSTLSWSPRVFYNNTIGGIIVVIIIFAAITKRAQIPFSSWLPAAIAAPTPISALVHSSTLVTAGVYLIYRFYPILNSIEAFRTLLLYFSTLTMFIAGYAAVKEMDIKKVIALSTLRQLGVMIFRLRVGLPELALFHLITHATFKALLFIAAGNFILQVNHRQDIRQFGSIYSSIPLTFSAMTIANLALIAFPFIAGYYSKDLIIEICIFNKINIIIIVMLIVATGFTIAYTLRFSYRIYGGASNTGPLICLTNKDKNINLAILTLTSYVVFRGASRNWLITFPYIHPTLDPMIKWIITIMMIRILIVTSIIRTKKPLLGYNPNWFTRSIWLINYFNSQLMLKIYYNWANKFYQLGDLGWNELGLGKGLKQSITPVIKTLSNLQRFNLLKAFLILLLLVTLSI